MHPAFLTAPQMAFCIFVMVAVLLGIYLLRPRAPGVPAPVPAQVPAPVQGKPSFDNLPEQGDVNRDNLENYRLILDTLDRSNVLLWWARVDGDAPNLRWKIRTPPQLSENPIFRLAALAEKGWLWQKEQAPDLAQMDRNAERALASGATGYQQEFRIIGTDGMHWLSEEVVIRRAGPGEWNLAGVLTDVTKRHEAEEARRFTEGQLDQILRGADCLLWQAMVTGDPEVRLQWRLFIPPSVLYKKIFGEDSIPETDKLWTEPLVEEWDQIRDTSRKALRENRRDYEQEYHVNNRGNTFLLHEHVEVTRLGKDSWNLVGVIVDITARRDAELALAAEKERLAVTLGSMTEGVITFDPDGSVLFINRAAADLTQWEASETVGRPVSEVCVLENAKTGVRTTLPVKEVLEAGINAELPQNTLMRGRADRIRLVEGRLVPIANVSSKRVGAVLVLRDITERQRMEEKLQNAAKMESVGILAGGIAHDFNNILTAVLSNLTLLQLDLSAMPDQAALLDEAVRATKRAGDLTLQLLTFAKGGDPVRSAVQLAEIVKESATFAHRGSGVKSDFDLPDDLWAANVDKAQISQVIQNLVINATQAMPVGGTLRIEASNVRILAGSHGVLSEGDYICIAVADTGAGIAPEHLGRIFDPYFTTKLQGHGLGLATVFSIIKRHQGHIEVSSILGKGTVFTFWLPAAPGSESTLGTTRHFAAAIAGGRVLFMDDEVPILTMAERLMRRMGLEFESVSDGAEAIKRYKSAKEAGRPFDLVVMDLTIPGGMGGREAISILRQYDPAVRAIVSSGYSSDLAMADFRKHGFMGMVAKPYDISELASVIRGVLAEKGQSRSNSPF
ncbi:MAG TPA: ATP-binding protein [Opitutaceae bacterium]